MNYRQFFENKSNTKISEKELADILKDQYNTLLSIRDKYDKDSNKNISLNEAINTWYSINDYYITDEYLYGIDGDT